MWRRMNPTWIIFTNIKLSYNSFRTRFVSDINYDGRSFSNFYFILFFQLKKMVINIKNWIKSYQTYSANPTVISKSFFWRIISSAPIWAYMMPRGATCYTLHVTCYMLYMLHTCYMLHTWVATSSLLMRGFTARSCESPNWWGACREFLDWLGPW